MAGAVPQISVQDVKYKLDNGEDVFLLDVRTPEEYETAHIDGSHLFPMDEIPARLDELREAINARPVITICHHGGTGTEAIKDALIDRALARGFVYCGRSENGQ